MRIPLFLMLMIFGFSSFSQKLDSVRQKIILEDLESLDPLYDFQEIIDSCHVYLPNANCGRFREELIELKIQSIYNWGLNLNETNFLDSRYYFIRDSILDKIIEIISEEEKSCANAIETYKRMKYEYLYDLSGVVMPEFNNGKDPICETEEFLAISPQYFFGNNQWIGLEFYFGYFEKRNKMKYIDNIPMFSANAIGFSFRKNISVKEGWGLNFSLLSFSGHWINLRPINLSYLNNGELGSVGYSPELGFQFWYLHLNAGYNLAFKKSMRSYEKLYFTAKFDIPFYRF